LMALNIAPRGLRELQRGRAAEIGSPPVLPRAAFRPLRSVYLDVFAGNADSDHGHLIVVRGIFERTAETGRDGLRNFNQTRVVPLNLKVTPRHDFAAPPYYAPKRAACFGSQLETVSQVSREHRFVERTSDRPLRDRTEVGSICGDGEP